MSKIVTVTFNPTIDKFFTIKKLYPNSKIHAENVVLKSGGGGINISKVLEKHQIKSKAIIVNGGRNASLLRELLTQENLVYQEVIAKEEIRENIIIKTEIEHQEYRFNMPLEEHPQEIFEKVLELIQINNEMEFLVLSGTFGKNFSSTFYKKLFQWSEKNKLKIVVDTKGNNLKMVTEIGAFLIKPNKKEFEMIISDTINSNEEIITAAKKIIAKNKVKNIIVSLGNQGAILVNEHQVIVKETPKINMVGSVGAGDSMVAGIIFQLCKGKDLENAINYGVLCGSAAAINSDNSIFKMEDLEKLQSNK